MCKFFLACSISRLSNKVLRLEYSRNAIFETLPFKSWWWLNVKPCLIKIILPVLQRVLEFLWFLGQLAFISLYSIKLLLFVVKQTEYVSRAVRITFLNVIQVRPFFFFKGLNYIVFNLHQD
jgi:hypothetical protein